jgi:DNA mismatch repair protein MutL
LSRIHILSDQTIDQIAAGEVIENPASVVKELFENAVDAGARHIVVETLGGGFQSIRVSDDGSGMPPEDALLSVKRHATSKIRTAEDLSRLRSMGFRGEALASIAAISTLIITTACPNALGIQVEFKAGILMAQHPSARTPGTTIEVRSLFYNVPARKKFQKSAAVSSAEITRVVTLLALAHPTVGVELIQQRREIFCFPASFLKKRCADLLGADFSSEIHEIQCAEKGYRIQGVLKGPSVTRHNRSGQYLFVNARPVHCLPLAYAIRDGYGTRIDSTRHPVYALHIEVDPACIDVNVHPQKKEIRIQDEEEMKRLIRSAVQLALQPEEKWDIAIPAWSFQEVPMQDVSYQTKEWNHSEQISFPLQPNTESIGVFQHYLILDAKSVPWNTTSGVVWIDLKAAEARILFEQLIQEKQSSQALLVPIPFSCSKAEAEKLSQHVLFFEELGIALHPIAETTYLIDALPPYLKEKEIADILHAVLEENCTHVKQCAQAIAQRSRKTTYALSEALGIFQELLKTADPLHCPKGKPTYYHQRQDEIDKHFYK